MRASLTRGGVLLAVLFGLPTTGAFAAVAALICHPDPPGTKTVRVNGAVERYRMHGTGVSIVYRGQHRCLRTQWKIGAALTPARRLRESACTAGAVRPARSSRVALVSGSADLPDRVRVVSASGAARSWPLPEHVQSVDAYGLTGVFAGAEREVYAIDLSSGRTALVGLDRHGDRPQIDAPGVVFQDNLAKKRERSGRTLMKFIPSTAVDRALSKAGRPLDFAENVETIGMDGFRVALALHRQGECAQIMYWNIAWDYLAMITDEDERTCHLTENGGVIRSIAIAGIRSAWVIRSRRTDRILTSNSTACFDRIVVTVPRRDGKVTALSGDGPALAYAASRDVTDGNVIGIVRERSVRPLVRAEGAPVAMSADDGQLAILNGNGTIDLRLARGELAATVQEPDAAALALRANRLVVLTRSGRLHVFASDTWEQVSDWAAPAGVSPHVDVQFGVAVLTAGRRVFAVSLKTGRRVVLARAPGVVQAEIEPPGVAYAYNTSSGGHLRFIRFAEVEAALR